MRIRNMEIGPTRWYLMIKPDSQSQNKEFKSWMDEHCPEVFCQYRFNYGDDPYWEVRGTDPGVRLYIIMRWSN